MRVLLVDQYGDPGGAQQCLVDLAPAFLSAGWSVHAAVPGQSWLAGRLEAAGVTVHPLSLGRYSSGRKRWAESVRFSIESAVFSRRLARIVRRIAPDALYVNGPRTAPAAAAARGRARMLFHCHHRIRQRSAVWLLGRSLRSADASVVACCRWAAEPIRGAVADDRLRIVYNGVAEPAPCPADGQGPRPRIGVIGRIAPEKGQDHFLQAARRIHKAIPEARFVICGDALFSDPAAETYKASLIESAKGLPVDFPGWREDVDRVLAGLDLLVVPSVEEPATTRVILEAYAAGTPVVAYATGGIGEVVRDGETGLLVRECDPAQLASRAIGLLGGPPERLRRLAENGRALWREKFTLDRFRREIVEALERAARLEVHGR